MSYHAGDLVRITAAWTDADGDPADPTAVFAAYSDPSGNVTTLEYNVDVELVRDSAGNYHVDIDADEAGKWRYRFYSTGTGQASSNTGQFLISANEI